MLHKKETYESNVSSARHLGGVGRIRSGAEFRLVGAGIDKRIVRIERLRFPRQRNIFGPELGLTRKRVLVVFGRVVPDFQKAQEKTSQGRQHGYQFRHELHRQRKHVG